MMSGKPRSSGRSSQGALTMSRWLVATVAVLAGLVAVSCGNGDDEMEQLATATDLAETWVARISEQRAYGDQCATR